ncbi:MAG: class I SAM-dependent methyltransferase [Desulfovibrio sp.]|jgi:hypothetical protein|nr:class I SAM-dependent methyltransferase [Desulfovibrio sp.]
MNGNGTDFLHSPEGSLALESGRDLMRALLSAWPRRARSVLFLGAGVSSFAENLWEDGFEVTVQDSNPQRLESSRQVLGGRVEFVLSAPNHLPFDDGSFDYVVAGPCPVLGGQAEGTLEEMGRLACSGVLIIFFNACSIFALECRLRRKNPLYAQIVSGLQSPRALAAAARRIFVGKSEVFASILPGPLCTWRRGFFLEGMNSVKFPLPIGALAALRVDLGSMYAGAPLLLRTNEPAVPAQS